MTEPAITGVTALALLGAGGLGVICLHRAWIDRAGARPWWILGGWLVLAGSTLASTFWLGGARGVFVAIPLISCAAYGLVAVRVEVRHARGARVRSSAPEPSDRPSHIWRGWLRAFLAGPIGMIAAMGTALFYVTWAPGDVQTRLVIGGLLVPILWGGAMAWTLADDRILRATAVLVGGSLATFTAAVFRGFS